MRIKIIRATTVPSSLKILLKGQLRFLSQNGFDIVGLSSPGEELEEVKTDEDVRVVGLEMKRQIAPLNDAVGLLKMIVLLRKEKPLIIHTHTPKAGMLGMIAGKITGVPVRLHTVAGLPLMETRGFKRAVLNIVEKITYACATKIYPNSFSLKNFIIESNFTSSDKLAVIGNGSSNGINTRHFLPQHLSTEQYLNIRESLGISPADFVFVFVGRLVKDKGINELVKSFTQLDSKNKKLLLVGAEESELDPLSLETLEEIRTNGNIIPVGFKKDVRPYFSISDALVFPSYREGFPNVVMQAGAMGLPCVVTDISGSNEIIINGKNGLIIPPKNVDRLTEAMNHIANDKEFFNLLKSKSRDLIVSRYEQEFYWNELLKEYKKVLKDV